MKKPVWIKQKIKNNETVSETSELLKQLHLNTVCKEAKCPNIYECFSRGEATFLILGKNCTRSCQFCNVSHEAPTAIDPNEPNKIAQAIFEMKLKYVVITSVTRDDLADSGAEVFAETTSEIKKMNPNIKIELLIPDLKANSKHLKIITDSRPDTIGHNLETVSRLYSLRPEANYQASLRVLKIIKDLDNKIYTKSALMLGLGETENEVIAVMEDLIKVGCDFLALGQYLPPSTKNTGVKKYITPVQFENYKTIAGNLGFKHVESAPFVRSSYRASEYLDCFVPLAMTLLA